MDGNESLRLGGELFSFSLLPISTMWWDKQQQQQLFSSELQPNTLNQCK